MPANTHGLSGTIFKNFMNNLMKRGAYMLLVACLSAGMVGCDDDDPDYENVQPPVVEVAASHISGVVSSMSGDAIQGATVKATADGKTLTATTDADGAYTLDEVVKGTYAVEVSAEGKQTVNGEITISKDGEIGMFNAMLANVGKEVEVSTEKETQTTVTTEAAKDNKEAEVEVDVVIPAAAVEDPEAKIVITPVYTEEAAKTKADTRAAKSTMLMGTQVTCNKADVNLSKPIDLTFDLGEEVASVVKVQKYANGKWSDADARQEGGKVIVSADEFGTYSVFADIEVTSKTSSEAISFGQAEFDNLYGSKDMNVTSTTYTYKQGGEIDKATGRLNAQLRQILANQIKGNSVRTATGTYDLNVTLPVGTALTLSGRQELTTVTATCEGKSASGKVYGSVTVAAVTYNRQHNGGTN